MPATARETSHNDDPRSTRYTAQQASGWDRLSVALFEDDPRLTKTQDVIRFLFARHFSRPFVISL